MSLIIGYIRVGHTPGRVEKMFVRTKPGLTAHVQE